MKLLLEGSLSETLTLKELLVGIMQAEATGLSLLRLCTVDRQPYGDLFFLGGHYVVDARLNESEVHAEEAFYHLLQIKDANFYYYSCESLEELPANKPLKVDLKELINQWQNILPAHSNQLLDKIFNNAIEDSSKAETTPPLKTKEENTEKPFRPINKSADKASLGFTGSQEELDWGLVNPLLVSGGPNDNAISLIGAEWEDNVNTSQLRSLYSGRGWQRKLSDLVLILIMLIIALIVILCFAWLMINSPSADLNPRRFSIHSPASVKKHILRSPVR